jgi:hypothetical protein
MERIANVALVFTALTRENLRSVENLLLPYLERQWSREFTDEFLSWRLLDRKFSETILALNGEECVAMVNSYIRQYAIDGRKSGVRETDFWISKAEYRPFASLRVLQTLMAKPEPISAVVGNDYVASILQRLRWEQLTEFSQMVLPLGAGVVSKRLAKQMKRNIADLPPVLTRPFAFKLRNPKRQPAPAPSATFGEITDPRDLPDIMPPAGAHVVTPLAEPHDFEWYAAAPDPLGEFAWLGFKVGDEPVALALVRLYREGAFLGAKILHVQSSLDDMKTYAWILGETSAYLSDRGADWIDARFSSPVITAALHRIGYVRGRTQFAYWWAGSQETPEGQYVLPVLFRGEGLAPYPF